MSDPRWTDETVDLVARADRGINHYFDEQTWEQIDATVQEGWREDARAILGALADAGLLVEPGSETRPPLPADMELDRCGLRHPDYPDVRCDRPGRHNHHGGNDADGVTRELWLDSYLGRGSETRVEWAAQSVWRDGQTRHLWPCVDEGEARRALNDPLTGDMVGRRALSRTIHIGPWQVVDATAEAINGAQT